MIFGRGMHTLDCTSSLFTARASNPFCTPSKAGSISFGEDVEANKFRRLLLPRLFEAEPSLDPEDEEETLDEELDPEEILLLPNCGIPGVTTFLGDGSRKFWSGSISGV